VEWTITPDAVVVIDVVVVAADDACVERLRGPPAC
jgi:hypothetical protein